MVVVVATIVALGFVNEWVVPLHGAGNDSGDFIAQASRIAEQGGLPPAAIGEPAYLYYLSLFARVSGAHWFVLNLSSVLPAAAALFFISAIAGGASPRAACIAVFGMLACPGFLLHAAVPFREALQLASLTGFLAVYLAAPSPFRAAVAAPLLLPAMLSHPALFLFGLLAVAVLVVIDPRRDARLLSLRAIAALAMVCVLGYAALGNVPLWYGEPMTSNLGQGLTELVLRYRAPIDAARPATDFGIAYDRSDVAPLISLLLRNYAQYLVYPLIAFEPGAVHLVLGWEAVLRIAGLAALVVSARNPALRGVSVALIAYFLCLTFLWSIGTTNGGQAFRHHALTQWVPVTGLAMWLSGKLPDPEGNIR